MKRMLLVALLPALWVCLLLFPAALAGGFHLYVIPNSVKFNWVPPLLSPPFFLLQIKGKETNLFRQSPTLA